eukprot:TRINITY_DN10725_c1_g1_i1.p1 TRINITY_DN10725_c1_g1~~TRINITY_DN10725_c1_g1_i1.p1  ORF type:complete len:144 (+),score=22.46 TRINITY_DN10725_c1_g1_i1:160-591(+)
MMRTGDGTTPSSSSSSSSVSEPVVDVHNIIRLTQSSISSSSSSSSSISISCFVFVFSFSFFFVRPLAWTRLEGRYPHFRIFEIPYNHSSPSSKRSFDELSTTSSSYTSFFSSLSSSSSTSSSSPSMLPPSHVLIHMCPIDSRS